MKKSIMMACALVGFVSVFHAEAQTSIGKTYSFTDRYADKSVSFQVDFLEAQTFRARLVETKKDASSRSDTLLINGSYAKKGDVIVLKDNETDNQVTIVQAPQHIAVTGTLVFPSRNTITLNHSNRWH